MIFLQKSHHLIHCGGEIRCALWGASLVSNYNYYEERNMKFPPQILFGVSNKMIILLKSDFGCDNSEPFYISYCGQVVA